jgi:hypothetical protein
MMTKYARIFEEEVKNVGHLWAGVWCVNGEEGARKTKKDLRDSWITRKTNCAESQYVLG